MRLPRLLPPGAALAPEQLVEQLGLWERPTSPPARPHVMLNMVTTVDGRATLGGRSGAISGGADRALFHALRTGADGVLVGAGTVRTERYGRIISDEPRRRERARRGLSEEPLACIVSGRLVLGEEIPLLQAARGTRRRTDRLGGKPARDRRPDRLHPRRGPPTRPAGGAGRALRALRRRQPAVRGRAPPGPAAARRGPARRAVPDGLPDPRRRRAERRRGI